MSWLLLAVLSVLVFGSPASADVRFMQLGDPQFGKTCHVTGSTNGRYLGLSRADCIAEQRRNLHGMLQYASDIGIRHAIFMGDQNENVNPGGSDEEIAFAAEIALFPDIEFHYVIGNHETHSPCTGISEVLLDPYGLGSGIPHWQSFTIGYVHFFIANSSITSYDNINCYNLDDGACIDIANGVTGGCDASPTDAAGVGTCAAASHICRRYEDYAVAQEAALSTAVSEYNTAYAAGTASAFFFVSHIALWNQNNADVAAIDDGIHQWHNMRTCTGGANDGLYCNDKTGYDCPDGACNVDVADRQWRSQAETILAGLATTTLGLFGHTHADTVWSGTTVNGAGMDYYFVISTGSSIPYPEATWWTDLTGNIWTCTNAGACTYQTILATPQSVELHGVTLSGMSAP